MLCQILHGMPLLCLAVLRFMKITRTNLSEKLRILGTHHVTKRVQVRMLLDTMRVVTPTTER